MSLSVSIKTPRGVVMATDSRLTAYRQVQGEPPAHLFFDSCVKVWTLGPPNTSVAVSFVGMAATGIRAADDLVQDYAGAQGIRKPLREIARELHESLSTKGLEQTSIVVSGYDSTIPLPQMFKLDIPGKVSELYPQASFGVALGGKDALARKIVEHLSPPVDMMPLRNAASFAAWLIRTATEAQGFTLQEGLASVGGDVQIVLIEKGRSAQLYKGGSI